jgi:arylsulfatase A-like enzyme
MIVTSRAGRILVAAVAGFASLSVAATATSRPNVILIVSDNQGYRDLGCFGSTEVVSPHFDRMAAEGVKGTNFYVTSPACTPSRGSILTGRYPQRNGLYEMIRNEMVRYGHRYTPEEYAYSPEMTLGMDEVPPYLKLVGFNLLSVLQGHEKSPRAEMFWQSRNSRAARVGRFKWVEAPAFRGLFDLERDPGEERDLSREEPEKLRVLMNRWSTWRREMDAAEPRGPVRNYCPQGFGPRTRSRECRFNGIAAAATKSSGRRPCLLPETPSE